MNESVMVEKMNNDYPVKYVVMYMTKPGFAYIYEKEKINIMGHFVSYAYLINEVINKDGTRSYNVVIPFFNNGKEENAPLFDEKGNLLNGVFVSEIYDTRDKAIAKKNQLNEVLINEKLSYEYNLHKSARDVIKKVDVARFNA